MIEYLRQCGLSEKIAINADACAVNEISVHRVHVPVEDILDGISLPL
jgi:hypothetical protein